MNIIPIVHLGDLGLGNKLEPNDDEYLKVGKEITEAFMNIGFVYLAGHGIPDEIINDMLKAGEKFFNLPHNDKNRMARSAGQIHGYVGINAEKFDPKYSYELREGFYIRDRDGNFPDDNVSDLRPTSLKYMTEMTKLTMRILKALALGLELDKNHFINCHQGIFTKDNSSCIKLLHYPPVHRDLKKNTIRCGAHCDYGTITLLLQDDIGGLNVRDIGGNWINADPIPGTFLVNVGDMLQFWTCNKLKATEHRVVIPKEEIRQQRSRHSVPFFVQPDDDVLIIPISGNAITKPITAKDYLVKKYNETYK